MENQQGNNQSRKTLRRSSNSHISMSDTESTTSQVDSWHSPLRSDSPFNSEDPCFLPETDNLGGSPVVEEVSGGKAAVERRSALKTALVLRVIEVIVCLTSFSVMAADKTQGWSGDSFDRYREYRYCLGVNIIGFVYSSFQAYDVAYHLGTEKHLISHHLRCHFDFSMDQIVAYLLMSASSSAATRVTDWISNWGKDEFTLMATASIAMSFVAFFAFAFSSLISAYNLCHPH